MKTFFKNLALAAAVVLAPATTSLSGATSNNSVQVQIMNATANATSAAANYWFKDFNNANSKQVYDLCSFASRSATTGGTNGAVMLSNLQQALRMVVDPLTKQYIQQSIQCLNAAGIR